LPLQRELKVKVELQRTEIINEYNTLLRNRGVGLLKTEFIKFLDKFLHLLFEDEALRN
jgi:hypothetical protein